MIFFKNKSQKLAELVAKFPKNNIEYTRKMIENSKAPRNQTETKLLLDTLEKNFARLVERYKFNQEKIAQILFDAVNYDDILKDMIINIESVTDYGYPTQEYADQQRKKDEDDILKIQEIERRFKLLLGEEYIDPIKLMEKNN